MVMFAMVDTTNAVYLGDVRAMVGKHYQGSQCIAW